MGRHTHIPLSMPVCAELVTWFGRPRACRGRGGERPELLAEPWICSAQVTGQVFVGVPG
jgi:hypothetical protein